MAFNKVCMVLIALFALASMANANADPMFPLLHRPVGASLWSALRTYKCVKVIEDGEIKSYLVIEQIITEGSLDVPVRDKFCEYRPGGCTCKFEVEKCHPGASPSSALPTYKCEKVIEAGEIKSYLVIKQRIIKGYPQVIRSEFCDCIPGACTCKFEVEKCHPGSKTTLVA